MTGRRILQATVLAAAVVLCRDRAYAQVPADSITSWGRRAGGVQVAAWRVSNPETASLIQPTYQRSLMIEAYFKRGLAEHIALESSVSVWWRSSTRLSVLGDTVDTRVYIVPLLTSLRIYPFTHAGTRIEPYLVVGAGLALGVENQSRNAEGGGGRNIATGFGVKAGSGVEVNVYGRLGVTLSAHVQAVRFGEAVDDQEAYSGSGLQGGLSYRFNF